MLNSLFGNLLGGMPGIAPRNTVPAAQGFPSDLQIPDGDAAFDTAAEVFALIGAVNNWWTIWERTVPAQMAYHFGYGKASEPENQGYMYFYAASAAAFDIGTLRLNQVKARRMASITVFEAADSSLHAQVAAIADPTLIDKRQMKALPEQVRDASGNLIPLVGEDSLLQIQYFPTTLVVETQAAFKIPVTIYQ